MSSQARQQLDEGLAELNDLEALIQLKTKGSKGPTAGISAARRSAVLLLNAHFEAYLEDLLQEALAALNPGLNAHALARDFTTPRPKNIDRFFLLLGIQKLSQQPSWQKADNKAVRRNIDDLQDARNAIAHGETGAKASKADIERFRKYVRGFADAADIIVSERIEAMRGSKPW